MANYFCTDSVEEQVDLLTDKVTDLNTKKLDKAAVVQATGTGTDVVMSQKAVTDTINQNLQTINTELNGKLTKPINPSAESAVTMLADGTVGTKLLSEIGGGGKLYKHRIVLARNGSQLIDFYFYRSTNTHIPLNEMRKYFIEIQALYMDENMNYYTGYAHFSEASVRFKGTIIGAELETTSWKLANLSNIPFTEFEVDYSVTEL